MNFESIIELQLAGYSVVRWASVLAVILLTMTVLTTLKRFIMRRIRSLSAEHEDLEWLNYVEEMFSKSKFFLYLAVGLFTAIAAFDVGATLTSKTTSVVQICILLQLGIWGSAFSNLMIQRLQLAAEDDPAQVTALSAASVVIRIVIWSVTVLLALANLGFDITALVASLGIGGVAIALASQAILADLLAFFSIIIDKPFLKGDFIIVGNFVGSIEHIGIKTTRVRSLQGEQVIFSNQDLLQSRIRNFKRMENRRVVMEFGVPYDTPLEDLEAIPGIVQDVIESLTSEDVPVDFDRAHLHEFGESALLFETVYAVLSPSFMVHMDIRQAILTGLLREFRARQIEIAFPTRTVHVQQTPPRTGVTPTTEAAAVA